MQLEAAFTLILAVVWAGAQAIDRYEHVLPNRWRVELGYLGVDDPQTVTEIELAYARGLISFAEKERRLEVAHDPRTEQIRSAVEPVPGIGPELSLAIASSFESEAALREADVDELEDVPGVGEKRAVAIQERLEAGTD